MEQLIATIEKGQPFFNAIARNKYLKAIRDGFISVIPIIIFSSIFCLVASVPNIWGFYWPDDINNALWKCYNYSMGILAIACAATTAKHFADAQNRDLPKNNQINFISCMCAAIIGFLLIYTFIGINSVILGFLFALVAGIMVFISLDELLPTAKEYGAHHLSIYGLVAGMGLMAFSLLLF